MADVIAWVLLVAAIDEHGRERVVLAALAVLCVVGGRWAERRKGSA